MKPVGTSKKTAKAKAVTKAAPRETSSKSESSTPVAPNPVGYEAPDLSTSSAKDGPGTALTGAAPAPRDPGLEERRVGQAATVGAVLVVTGAVGSGLIFGPATAVLVLAAGAFVAVIALFWSSLRTLLGETPLSGADAYAIGAARAEEEQKRAVLRALKDLEFERSVGKISEDDYKRLVTHYRGEAKRLLRILDEKSQPMRDRADELISARLKKAGLTQSSAAVFRDPGKHVGERAREADQEEALGELREAASEPVGNAEPEAKATTNASLETKIETQQVATSAVVDEGTKSDIDETAEDKADVEADTKSPKEALHE